MSQLYNLYIPTFVELSVVTEYADKCFGGKMALAIYKLVQGGSRLGQEGRKQSNIWEAR